MRSIKIMLTGLMLAVLGVFFGGGGEGAGLAFALIGIGLLLFIIGLLYDIVKK